jgi:hypothetical protein
MKKYIISILCFFSSFLASPQSHVKIDSSHVVVRSFDAQKLGQLKRDEDFQYERSKQPTVSLWDRVWDWVWWHINQVFETKAGRITIKTILILAAVAVIVFFVMNVTGMKGGGLFGRSSYGDLSYSSSEEDINSISFEDAIKQAIDRKDYRLAVRLLYLQTLKKLSDNGYINWQLNKTNSDYFSEVENKPWQSIFKKLTRIFEYTWYGEMNVGNEQFQELQAEFQQFNNQLK